MNAIIVSPCDSKSIGTSIKAANDAGIPVFTADIACLAEDAKIITHVASDNIEGGRLAAQAVAQAINGRGKVAIIDHPEVESVIQRVKGFEEEIANYPDIVVAAKLTGRGMKDQAFRTTEDILQSHPDLAAVFGINDDSALGALAAIEKAGKQGTVKIIGFDAVPEARAAIKDGKIFADVIQRPHEIGIEDDRGNTDVCSRRNGRTNDIDSLCAVYPSRCPIAIIASCEWRGYERPSPVSSHSPTRRLI